MLNENAHNLKFFRYINYLNYKFSSYSNFYILGKK